MATIGSRLKHAWNAFANQNVQDRFGSGETMSYGSRPDRTRIRIGNERSIISSIYTRLAIDVAAVSIKHVRTDDQGRYSEDIDSGLNNCLTLEANIDQAARHFRQDIATTLFESGVAAIVPVDTTINPATTGGYDIQTMRVGTIVGWTPTKVRVLLYNEQKGYKQEITLDKSFVAIVENPLYSVMNESSSTLQRLVRKLALLDAVDEASSSGKLDLIIQLPYVIKSETKRQQAEQRRKDIEVQLKGSQYGIAYTDGTEKVTQLNRPTENSLLNQVQYLTDMLYSQLGLTPEVMNGTADAKTMLNYNNRTIEPILNAIVEAMRRTFLTKTARTQGQTIMFLQSIFKFISFDENFGNLVNALSRNEITSGNEIRQLLLGLPPSTDPNADKLKNANMPDNTPAPTGPGTQDLGTEGDSQHEA